MGLAGEAFAEAAVGAVAAGTAGRVLAREAFAEAAVAAVAAGVAGGVLAGEAFAEAAGAVAASGVLPGEAFAEAAGAVAASGVLPRQAFAEAAGAVAASGVLPREAFAEAAGAVAAGTAGGVVAEAAGGAVAAGGAMAAGGAAGTVVGATGWDGSKTSKDKAGPKPLPCPSWLLSRALGDGGGLASFGFLVAGSCTTPSFKDIGCSGRWQELQTTEPLVIKSWQATQAMRSRLTGAAAD